jgi:hypothetical protein
MNATSLLAIGGGAVLGAWLRYALGLWLNPLLPVLPVGTLVLASSSAQPWEHPRPSAAGVVFVLRHRLLGPDHLLDLSAIVGLRTAQYGWAAWRRAPISSAPGDDRAEHFRHSADQQVTDRPASSECIDMRIH